jgi:hypothetical protein
MNYFVALFFLIVMMGSFLALNAAYGMWMPLSPEDLLKQSKTVFVGTVIEINPVDVKYQSQMARNGTIKEKVGPETMTLEEYTVDVEEFLKNPQETNTIKVLRATVSGVPTGPSKISGFDVGDRVLFYLPKDEKQTHFAGQYLPESFRIPEQCNAAEVLDAKRIEGRNDFTKTQNGIILKDNFTAYIPIQFRYYRDAGTLFGQSFDVSVGINKATDNRFQNVFQKRIQVKIDPCMWIGSAQWDFVPQPGEYRMNMHISENGEGSGISTRFFVIDSNDTPSPLKQIQLGITFNKIQCKHNLVLIQKYDYSPACVKPETKQKLVERGWMMPDGFDHTAMLERGNVAMGFDQNKIHHHFMSTMTGGEIMIMSKNMSDVQTINEIRDHIKTIQYEFSQGNFTNPFYIHAQVVPGTDIMTTKRNLIQYAIQDIDGGSSLILTTNDTELLNAIQQFMDFQSSQHVGH